MTLPTIRARWHRPPAHTQPTDSDTLARWESWPLWALGISQGLNVFRWYVHAQMPAELVPVLGWLIVLAGIAAAASLDGAMIATVMARRQGRNSWWSSLATAGAMLFSAGIALDVHGGLDASWAWLSAALHIAQPVQMFLYLQHLSARRTSVQPVPVVRSRPRPPVRRVPRVVTLQPARLTQDDTPLEIVGQTSDTMTLNALSQNETIGQVETKEQRIRDLMTQHGKSRSTIHRWLETGKVKL